MALSLLGIGMVVGSFFFSSSSVGQDAGKPIPATKELTSYREVVKNVLPAVVSIEAKAKKPAPRRRPDNFDQLPPDTRRFIEDMERRRDSAPDENLGFGSGWIVDPKGTIITNYHVVEGADEVEVHLLDGRKFATRDIIADKKTDLAIVRIQAGKLLPFLEYANSDHMEIGDRVLALGAPFGLTGSVTSGIVSAKGRNLRLNMYEDFLQTDAAINPGNSGGPLVNLEGKVIGVTAAIKSRSGGFSGVGLAISSNLAKSVMEQLLRDGVVKRGYLGVQIKDLDPDAAAKLGLKHGVMTTRVLDRTPASQGGMKVGDVIVSIAGNTVKDGRDLQRIVAGLPLRSPSDFEVVRDGKKIRLSVSIVEQPDDFGSP
jgi:serine protease Do